MLNLINQQNLIKKKSYELNLITSSFSKIEILIFPLSFF